MVAAVELRLDAEADRRVAALWRALTTDGVPPLSAAHRPHVSLAVLPSSTGVAAALAGISGWAGLTLSLDFVGQFAGGVLWLGVVPSAELLELHAVVHARLPADRWDLYRPGRWVPHCTVAMAVPEALMGAAVHRCLAALPIRASAADLVLTEYPPPPGRSPAAASDVTFED